ncbi:MAG: hypothetical protein WCT20_02215 [Candidatus Babeliales bacterium]
MKKLLLMLLIISASVGVISMAAMTDPDEPKANKVIAVEKTTDEEDFGDGDAYEDEFDGDDDQPQDDGV